MLVDTLGSGLLGSFELLYGHVVAGLSLPAAGAALSVGTALAIAAGPLAGAGVDRIGPTWMVIAANLVSAGGCVALLAAHSTFSFGLAVFVIAAGTRAFWASFALLVSEVTAGHSRRLWLGRIRAVRYAGLAAGQALAGVVLLLGAKRGLRVTVAGDAASYLLALALLAASVRAGTRATFERPAAGRGYRTALADRANVAFAALNIVATLLVTAPLMAMPVLVISQLRLPLWLPGALGALNTAAVALPILFAGRLLQGRVTPAALRIAALLLAAGCATYAVAASGRAVAFALLPLGTAVLGVGEAVYAPSADSLPLELAPPGLAGRYTALHQLAWGVSGALAPILTGALLAAGRQPLWAVLAVTALALSAAYTAGQRALADRLTT